MKKIILYILLVISAIFLEIGIYKSFAFDIVSSPTELQKWQVFLTSSSTVWSYFETTFGSGRISWYFPMSVYLNGSVLYTFPTGWSTVWNVFCDKHYFGLEKQYVYCQVLPNNPWFSFYHQAIIIDTKNWVLWKFYQVNNPWYTSHPLGGNWFTFSDDRWFFSDNNHIYRYNWTNIFDYTISTVSWIITYTLIQTIAKPSWSFDINRRIVSSQYTDIPPVPVYLSWLSWTHFFAYQGTDNKSYKVIDTFASGQDLPITSAGTGSVLPLGKFTYNDLILARQTAGSGSLYVQQADTATPQWETSTGYVLTSFNTFQNPVAYFTTSASTVVKWDMNCDYPWYDSCTLNGGVYKCTNSAGTLSPGGELCGGTVWTWPPPTCSDGIKNQNETMIDIGGVCGANCYDGIQNQDEVDVDFGGVCGSPSFSFSGFTCATQTRISQPTVWSGGYNFGQYPTVSEDHSSDTSWTFDFYSGSTHEDYFEAYGIASGSLVYSGSLKSLYADVKSTIIMGEPTGQFKMNIDIFSYVNTTQRKISYIAFNTKKNSLNQWSVFFKDLAGKEQKSSLVGIWWWIAVAYTRDNFLAYEWRVSELPLSFSFYGMEVGYQSETVTQTTECENGQWTCEVNYLWNTCSSQFYYGKARGTCGFVDNKCLPTTTLENADWSHSTTPVNNPATTTGPKLDENGDLDVWKDIFSCSETGFSVLICPFQIIGRIWEKVTDFLKIIANLIQAISSIGSPAWTGDIIGFIFPMVYAEDLWKSLISPWQVTSTWQVKPDSAPTYSGADYAGINYLMLSAWDNVKNMPDGGIKWIFAFAQWSLILLGITSLIVVVIIAIKN